MFALKCALDEFANLFDEQFHAWYSLENVRDFEDRLQCVFRLGHVEYVGDLESVILFH